MSKIREKSDITHRSISYKDDFSQAPSTPLPPTHSPKDIWRTELKYFCLLWWQFQSCAVTPIMIWHTVQNNDIDERVSRKVYFHWEIAIIRLIPTLSGKAHFTDTDMC